MCLCVHAWVHVHLLMGTIVGMLPCQTFKIFWLFLFFLPLTWLWRLVTNYFLSTIVPIFCLWRWSDLHFFFFFASQYSSYVIWISSIIPFYFYAGGQNQFLHLINFCLYLHVMHKNLILLHQYAEHMNLQYESVFKCFDSNL